jgi:CheY-like chemotaxis protein
MSNGQRVLIVDDNREIVCAARMRLESAGYDTLAAFDGAEGIKCARENHPDAIVLDVRMPVKDGLTTLAELRRDHATAMIPVVMLSASVVDQQAALEAGARFYLRKPFQGKQLLEAIGSIMAH